MNFILNNIESYRPYDISKSEGSCGIYLKIIGTKLGQRRKHL